jgi:hypothetical protein
MTLETLAELIETRYYERFIEVGEEYDYCFTWG